ncbi:MAG TPA: hypothetical protein VGY91_11835 [Chthoniobacterales bacterium]|jgi:hypothetical protein|nr:hypothetical protein [Chthoniobacterales bacterium]
MSARNQLTSPGNQPLRRTTQNADPRGRAVQGLDSGKTGFILGFDDGHFSEFGTFLIIDRVGHAPPDVLSQNLGSPESVSANIPKRVARNPKI